MIRLNMSVIKTIRTRLGMSQQEFGDLIGVTQGNVGHYEVRGQLVSVPVAARMIDACEKRGLTITFDDVYRQYLPRGRKRARPALVAAHPVRERGPRTRPKAAA